MIKLTLKDGSVREVERGLSAAEIVKGIGMGLYKASCCVKVNGGVCDLRTIISGDCEFEVMTFDSDEGKKAFWHTSAHILAQAVKRLYPNVKLGIGPAIDNGFYYDFDTEKSFTAEELVAIEAEMKKIVKNAMPLEHFELSSDDAIKFLKEQDEPYKVELCEEHIESGEPISFYKQGEFTDLCAGPHLMTTGTVKAFKLLSSTGAYWRGSEKNKMLTRIYGTAYPKASELEKHIKRLEEAKARDHNKLGRELELFTTVDVIGQGLPVLLPKGAKIIQILQRFVEDEEEKRGYLLTKTPLMAKSDLYKISGHWDHYKDGMFVMGDEEKDDEVFALRPMTCPFQYQVFLNRQRSYRDLPMRLAETSTLFRNEESGEMHGLIRVRQFTISEGHIICTPEQLENEFRDCVELANYMLETLGLLEDVSYRFSKWDPNDRGKYIGTVEQWNEAEGMMERILGHLGLDYSVGVGEAAFYGPKLDIQIKNVHGKEDTLITIQIDQMLAEMFGMEYVAADGTKKTPYIIHRTSLGCYERTLALLIEKYAAAFPLWLAPEQVRLIPIADRHLEYTNGIADKLKAMNIRCSVDERAEKVGYKIRQAQLEKIPCMIILGDNEMQDGTIALRSRRDGDLGTMTFGELAERLAEEIASRKI